MLPPPLLLQSQTPTCSVLHTRRMLPASAHSAPPLQHHSSSNSASIEDQAAPASQNTVWPSHHPIQAGSRQDRVTSLMSIMLPMLCGKANCSGLEVVCGSQSAATELLRAKLLLADPAAPDSAEYWMMSDAPRALTKAKAATAPPRNYSADTQALSVKLVPQNAC